jgi:hypothetical protein
MNIIDIYGTSVFFCIRALLMRVGWMNIIDLCDMSMFFGYPCIMDAREVGRPRGAARTLEFFLGLEIYK